MTGYNEEHGHTAAVHLVLANEQNLYDEHQRIVRGCWWDDEDNTWNGVDEAAEALRDYVTFLGVMLPRHDGYDDLLDAELSTVDWPELIVSELREQNLSEGRAADAGLADWL